MIVILEGADNAGKTTLARHLVSTYGARYLHLGPYENVWRWHLGAYLRAARLAASGYNVVVDRHWVSEIAYGNVYRDGSRYPVAARCLDRLWLRVGAIQVLCAPLDSRRQGREHYQRDLERKGNVYARDRHRDVSRVIDYYKKLRVGDPKYDADDYVASYVRAGDFTARPDVMVYDRFRQNARDFSKVLRRRAVAWRSVQHPLGLNPSTPNLAGHVATARWLLVGEKPSDAGLQRPDIKFPFVDRCTHLSAATWLNRALHRLDVREPELLWVNAHDDSLETLRCTLSDPPPAIALGRAAERELVRLGWPDVRHVPHPQWARRFEHRRVYAETLKEVLT